MCYNTRHNITKFHIEVIDINTKIKPELRNALIIGILCSVSYLGVYITRNILGAVTPQIIEAEGLSEEYIGAVSSLYFMFYAFGQLLNGLVGDRIKARYMISFGLVCAGITNLLFPIFLHNAIAARALYGMTGFFLSMIYAPMTKLVAENTEPVYATRCSLGYTFAAYFGSPFAGVMAAVCSWTAVFNISSGIMFAMGAVFFFSFLIMEKKGIVGYGKYKPISHGIGGGVGLLVKNRILRFTLVSILTGIVRTTVVFWMPTYFTAYLGYDPKTSAAIFTVATFVISFAAPASVFVFEVVLRRHIDNALTLFFGISAASFIGLFFVSQPIVNIALIVLAIFASNSAATMLWSRYCPSLRDTGMVSSATGYLDFVSYMAAAASSTIFANAVTSIGWQNLILVWFGIMMVGVVMSVVRFKVT